MTRSDAPDAPDRGERYIAFIHPFWLSVKSDVVKVVHDYNRRPPTRRRILVEDVGRRLSLRGDGYGLDVTLEVERERLRARYTRHPPRGETPTQEQITPMQLLTGGLLGQPRRSVSVGGFESLRSQSFNHLRPWEKRCRISVPFVKRAAYSDELWRRIF